MKICTKCNTGKCINLFRLRKNRSVKLYRVSVCIECERVQKSDAEKLRYKNMTKEEKEKHHLLSKESRKKEGYKKWRRDWQKEREKNDVHFLLKRRFSSLVRASIKKNRNSLANYLPYTIDELREHLEGQFEDWMSWENWGRYNPETWDDEDSSTWTWQIDHIIPVNFF